MQVTPNTGRFRNRVFYHFSRPALLALSFAAWISGCATAPADRGLSDVSAMSAARGGPAIKTPGDEDPQSQALIDDLLSQQIGVQDALRIALVHNPRIRAEFSRLGFATADVLEAGRLSNPTFSASVLFTNAPGAANQVGFGLAQNFTELLLLRSRLRFAKGEFGRAKLQAGAAVMTLTRDVESSYFAFIGAQQVANMRRTVAKSAAASAELAQRFFDAGNIADLALSVEKAASAQAELNLLSAERRAVEARADLNGLMGLPASETRWSVGEQLALPVAREDQLQALESEAQDQRLDLAAARQEIGLLGDALDVTKRYRWLGNADVGVQTERDADRSRITGPTLSVQLPIFNRNQGGIRRAESSLELAKANLTTLELEVSNQVALAHAKVLNARSRVDLHREKLVPLRERVVRRTQEQVNYMLVGVFDLIRARQEEYDAYQGYLEAVQDYWLSRTELALAIGAPLPSSAQGSAETVAPELPVPAPEKKAMGGMDGMNGMDMKGKPGMEGMEMGKKSSMPGMGKRKPGMDNMKGKEGMKGMDTKGTRGMEGMDQEASPKADPAAVKAVCDQIKTADMIDPLMQALALKCRKQEEAGKPAGGAPSSKEGMDSSPTKSKQGDKSTPKNEHGDH